MSFLQQGILPFQQSWEQYLNGCPQILTRGVACQKDSCEVRAHYHCFERSTRTKKEPACPKCRIEWPKDPTENMPLIGEEAAGDGDRPRGRRAQTQQTQDSDEDEAAFSAAEDDEEEGEASRPKKREVKKEKKPKKISFADESDVEMDEETSQPKTQAPRRSSRRG
jgi:non-structural maintenance of chromosomes element 1